MNGPLAYAGASAVSPGCAVAADRDVGDLAADDRRRFPVRP